MTKDLPDPPQRLDYGRQRPPNPTWFRWLVLGGCVLGACIIVYLIIDWHRWN